MKTTLNVRVDILLKISQAAQRKGLSRSDMIVLLIKKVMNDAPDTTHLGKMVQYQKKRKPYEWRTFHVRFRMDDYEYFLDLRKLFKMSVSLLLAYAVENYLDEVLTRNFSDNYQFRNYTVIREVVDNIIFWKLIWGFSVNIIEKRKV
ncbi:MAG TPA: hypothetical protein PLM53_05875 [Spirochaetota bacterium]|nr:hypothetical protein [Spirochaetota bacterium]HPC42362.1 hypothetical protein [Spirochaetota bacterium]HPL16420.1 hypothetical protein [Spirochaetota bacterium]HQF08049.1 hypothetical protein [Spirochaetota bacterium]HQH96609.1 hypothetical protein [Spirochaetota bacterium]